LGGNKMDSKYFYNAHGEYALIADITEHAWPIGSIFSTSLKNNPSELLGFGEWIKLKGNVPPRTDWKRIK
jgi:Baseplate structural protein Gp10, C-terminal domain